MITPVEASVMIRMFNDPLNCNSSEQQCGHLFLGRCTLKVERPAIETIAKFYRLKCIEVFQCEIFLKHDICKFIWRKEHDKQKRT